MVWYGMVWYGMIWYGMLWYAWHGMVWSSIEHGGTKTFIFLFDGNVGPPECIFIALLTPN